jgi:hypothetical protein
MHLHHHVRRECFHERALEKRNHAPQWKAPRLPWKVFFALFLLAATAPADEPRESWRVWLEPRFMRAPVSSRIPNSQRTEFAAGRRTEDGLVTLRKGDLEKLSVSWEEFFNQARANDAEDLAEVQAKLVRGKHKVIEYVELTSDRGLMASAVLAPFFLESFEEILGPAVLLVVPNRFTAYVFPRLASHYEEYAGMAIEAYRESTYPVSLEVFEITREGLHAFGTYADPAQE